MTKRRIIKFGVIAAALWLIGRFLTEWGSYDLGECLRLRALVGDERVREELIRWVDEDLDLESLDYSETGEHRGASETGEHRGAYYGPGPLHILEPSINWTLLEFTPDDRWHKPEVRLILPYADFAESRSGKVFANTKSVVFMQVTRVAVLVRTKRAEDFGVNPDYLKRVVGRVAVYCRPRD